MCHYVPSPGALLAKAEGANVANDSPGTSPRPSMHSNHALCNQGGMKHEYLSPYLAVAHFPAPMNLSYSNYKVKAGLWCI